MQNDQSKLNINLILTDPLYSSFGMKTIMLIHLYFLIVLLALIFFCSGLFYAITNRSNKDHDQERPQKAGPIVFFFLLAMIFFSIAAGVSVDIYTLESDLVIDTITVENNISTYVYVEKCQECHIDASEFAYLWSGMAFFTLILMGIYLTINTFGRN